MNDCCSDCRHPNKPVNVIMSRLRVDDARFVWPSVNGNNTLPLHFGSVFLRQRVSAAGTSTHGVLYRRLRPSKTAAPGK